MGKRFIVNDKWWQTGRILMTMLLLELNLVFGFEKLKKNYFFSRSCLVNSFFYVRKKSEHEYKNGRYIYGTLCKLIIYFKTMINHDIQKVVECEIELRQRLFFYKSFRRIFIIIPTCISIGLEKITLF